MPVLRVAQQLIEIATAVAQRRPLRQSLQGRSNRSVQAKYLVPLRSSMSTMSMPPIVEAYSYQHQFINHIWRLWTNHRLSFLTADVLPTARVPEVVVSPHLHRDRLFENLSEKCVLFRECSVGRVQATAPAPALTPVRAKFELGVGIVGVGVGVGLVEVGL